MAEDYLEIAKKIKEKFGEKVANIILFGSYARGDYSEESDIDILVIVKDEKIEDELRKLVYSFIPVVGRLISVKIVLDDEYLKMKAMNYSFLRSIEKEGIVIG